VDIRHQHILVWGGLRGALALALVFGLPPGIPKRDTIVTVVFGVVAFSVLVQGLTMPWLLRKLGALR
jgi:CPA1 family monovalent cation:H+ antiporter